MGTSNTNGYYVMSATVKHVLQYWEERCRNFSKEHEGENCMFRKEALIKILFVCHGRSEAKQA